MLTGTLTPVSNQADWIECYELVDDDTGDLIDISDATEIVVEIKDCPNGRHARLTSSLEDATVSHVSTGIFQWVFTASQMSGLCAGTYDVRARITKDDIVTQLFIGYLPVLDG